MQTRLRRSGPIQISQAMQQAGVAFVDGGIIGGPAWEPGTWLYLSGPRADAIAACFTAGPLATKVLDATIGRASSLKMCFAAYSKGTIALLAAILATAEHLGVREALEQQWSSDDADFAADTNRRVRQVTAKAWRFAGEMEEIAATFREAGLPGEFHAAAATIYHRLAQFKDSPATPALDEVLARCYRRIRVAEMGQQSLNRRSLQIVLAVLLGLNLLCVGLVSATIRRAAVGRCCWGRLGRQSMFFMMFLLGLARLSRLHVDHPAFQGETPDRDHRADGAHPHIGCL